MSRFLMSMFVPVLFAPNAGLGQTPAALVEGQHVRVAYRCKVARAQVIQCRMSRSPRVDTGRIHSVDGDTLRIRRQSSDADLAIPRVAIAQLWVVEGKKGNFWAGAGIGLVAGAVIGGAIGSTQEFCVLTCSSATFFGVIIGAPVGGLLGGAVGSQIQSDRWRPLPVSDLGVSVQPRPSAVGLRVSLAF